MAPKQAQRLLVERDKLLARVGGSQPSVGEIEYFGGLIRILDRDAE